MNIVLDNTVEIVSPTEKNEIGMVVIRGTRIGFDSIRWTKVTLGALCDYLSLFCMVILPSNHCFCVVIFPLTVDNTQ